MFTYTKQVKSSHDKSKVGKEIVAIILQDKDFWSRCEHIVKVSEPLMRVLWLIDNEEKSAMSYLYKVMDKAKEAIKTKLKNKVSQYRLYIWVIDARSIICSKLFFLSYNLILAFFFKTRGGYSRFA